MLISEEHKSLHYKLHISDPDYGGESVEYSPIISNIINQAQVESVLDYGSGKGELAHNLTLDHRVAVHLYDPAIPDISDNNTPQQMTTCVNVLEHVEKKYLDDVLDDLKRCTEYMTFIVITEDEKTMEWWMPKLMKRFRVESVVRDNQDFYVVATNGH